MGRRILAFFLGMIFGIVVLLGGVAGVLYYAATSVTPGDVYPDSGKFLGDFANMSLMDIYAEISKLYKEKIGKVGENGLYYTLGEFLEAYNIDTVKAFGAELHEDILEIPVIELFGGDMNAALGQIRVSAMFRIANLVGVSSGEEGEEQTVMFTEDAIAKVRDYSLADLFNTEKGVPYVFEDLLLSDVFYGFFPADPDDGNAIMWAFGQTSIGKLANGFGGKLLLQFRPNGVFEAMGSLPMRELFGESSPIMSVIFGNSTFGDLIDEDGNLNPDGLLDGVYLGSLVGLQRNEITDVEGYETLYPNGNVLYKEVDGKYVYVIEKDGVAYEAKLQCTVEHEHNSNCYAFVWYKADATEFDENDLATGIYNAIADVTVADLMSGDSNALIDRFMDIQLKELLDGQEVSSVIASLGDMTLRELLNEGVDNVYLGTILSNERRQLDEEELAEYTTVVISDGDAPVVVMNADGDIAVVDNGVWYEGKITCGQEEHAHDDVCHPLNPDDNVCGLEEHEHDVNCYKFVWYTDDSFTAERIGAQGYLCNFKLGEINSINSLVQSMTLTDVFGDSVPSLLLGIKDTPIKHLATAINNIYLGEFLEYSRKSVEDVDSSMLTIVYAPNSEGKPDTTQFAYYLYTVGGIALSTNGRDFYKGTLLCSDDTHEHTSKCYAFLWYDSEDKLVEGLMSKLADETVSNLVNLMETIQSLTLKDVLGDDVPDMLKSIENTPIGEISTAIENMYLGDFLGYTRNAVDDSDYVSVGSLANVKQQDENYIMQDGDSWYEAQLNCGEDHSHSEDCFDFVWYDCNNTAANHRHGEDCSIVEGMMGKLANEKVSELGNLSDKIMDFTLRDVMGDKVPDSLKAIQDTKIGELNTAIEEMYLGSFLGYERNPLDDSDYVNVGSLANVKQQGNKYVIKDGKIWYEAKMICNDKSVDHLHERSCFDFVWYTCGDLEHQHDDDCIADGVLGRMTSMKIKDLSADSLKDTVYNTTLGEVIDLSAANGLIRELSDTKIGELSGELNALYVGVAMGFHRNQVEYELKSSDKVITDTNVTHEVKNSIVISNANDNVNYYFLDTQHDRYYEAQLTCVESAHAGDESLHTFTCFGFVWYNCYGAYDESGNYVEHDHSQNDIVKGLNGKISNLRIDELSGAGMTNIATSLTIGDLIDSGMMNLGDTEEERRENEYKFALISCNNANHSFNETIGEGYLQTNNTYTCTIQDFFVYQYAKKSVEQNFTITAEEYWKLAHSDMVRDGELTEEGVAHKEEWKGQSLTDFINTLLGAL